MPKRKPTDPRTARRRFDILEPRLLMDANPVVGGGPPADAPLGESFDFTLSFDNNPDGDPGGDTGYGPFIDLIFPDTGQDGAGAESDDGITFNSASYLGSGVTAIELEFPDDGGGTGSVEHPLALDSDGNPLLVTGNAGDTLVVLQLPFGSYTPNQPAAEITVNATMSGDADVGAGNELNIQTRGGFQFGTDELANPSTDPSLIGNFSDHLVTPSLFTLSKQYNGPEGETATGPNFVRSYTITADIASGQSLTDFRIVDDLPDNLVFVGLGSGTTAGATIVGSAPNTSGPATGQTLEVEWSGSVSGEVKLVYEFYVPDQDATPNDILDPDTGNDVVVADPDTDGDSTRNVDATASATWNPTDGRDDPGTVTAVVDAAQGDSAVSFTAKAIATQKSVANVTDGSNTPGDVLRYEINFQVSDYFSFDDLIVSDTFSDGQRLKLDPGFTPTLEITERGSSVSGTFSPSTSSGTNLFVDESQIGNDTNPATDGSTSLSFDVSALLATLAADGNLEGGRAIGPDAGATTGKIVFYTTVQEDFSDTYASADPSVDQGDRLTNIVSVTGNVLENGTLNPTGFDETDGSSTAITIAGGSFNKAIYAVNGNPPGGGTVTVSPGDQVTYRLTYTTPATDFENLVFSDFLPKPVFDATTVTTFNAAQGSGVPAVGELQYGPSDTFFAFTGETPTINQLGGNAFSLDFGSVDDAGSTSRTIDVLFTVEVGTDPFADGLFLTNLAQAESGSTQLATTTAPAIVQVQLGEPELEITKGVIATDSADGSFEDGPTTESYDQNLTGVDGGDLVTFSIRLENTGSSPKGAFDVAFRDTIPDGFKVPSGGLNLTVTRGDGATFAAGTGYTDLGGGLFGSGLQLIDANEGGSTTDDQGALLAAGDPGGGHVVTVTYQLEVQGASDGTPAEAGRLVASDATLTNYTNVDGGTDFTADDLTDDASVEFDVPTVKSSLLDTEFDVTNNDDTQVVVGELVTYRIELDVPEGQTAGVVVNDLLDPGLAFVGVTSVVTDTGVSFTGDANSPTVTSNGRNVSFDLGTVSNANTDDGTNTTVVIEFTAVVNDQNGNTVGKNRNDNVSVTYQDDGAAETVDGTADAANVTVVQPVVDVTQSVAVNGGGTTGDAGDSVEYTITIAHTGGPGAFDLALADALPAELSGSTVSQVTDSAGTLTTASFAIDGSNNLMFAASGPGVDPDATLDLEVGRTITLKVTGTLAASVAPGQELDNAPAVTYSTLDGDVQNRSAFQNQSDERILTADDSDTIIINTPVLTKSVVSTSEGSTTADGGFEELTVGEVVRYRLVVELPESTLDNFRLVDTLPDGLQLIDSDEVRVSFVSDAAIGTPLTGADNDQNTPTFVLPSGNIATSGQEVTFTLGNTTVGPDGGDTLPERVVLEYNALVTNAVGVDNGDTGSTGFVTRITGDDPGDLPASNDVAIKIVEPSITDFSKAIFGTPPVDAGDSVTYRLTFSNDGSATAFDARLQDTLPDGLTLDPASITVTNATVASDTSDTGKLDLFFDPIAESSGTITVTYTASLDADVKAGDSLNSFASVNYTSLPGSQGSTGNATGSDTPGGAGTGTGERTGGSGAQNDYSDNDSQAFATASPTIDLTGVTNADAAIGETVTYDILVTLPEGVTEGLDVTHAVPPGLRVDSYAVITEAASSGGLLAADFVGSGVSAPTDNNPTGSGDDLTLSFGAVTTTGDNATNNNAFVVRVNATVLNVAGNQDATELDATAQLDFTDPETGTTVVADANAETVTVSEPELTLTTQVLSTSTGSTTGLEAGDTVTYRTVIDHAAGSSADAFEAVFADAAASGTRITTINSVAGGGLALADFQITGDGTGIGSVAAFDLTQTQQVVIEYTATLQTGVAQDASLRNDASVTWTSIDGSDTDERSGTGGELNGGSLNDYRLNADAGVGTGSSLVLTQTITDADTEYRIGEVVTVQLQLDVVEGTTQGVLLTNTLPAGLALVSGTTLVTTGHAGLSTGFIDEATSVSVSGQDVVFDLGDLTNPDNGNDGDDKVTVTFQALVLDDAVNNTNGAGKTNAAEVTSTSASGLSDSSDAALTVVEPVLDLSKSMDLPNAKLGQEVTFTITVDHHATNTGADAFDLVLTDTLAPGLALVPGSVTAAGGTVTSGNGGGDTSVGVTYDQLAVADDRTITYRALVTGDVARFGDDLTGSVDLAYDSLPEDDGGTDGADRDYTDSASATVTVSGADLVVTIDNGDQPRSPGDTFSYTVNVANKNLSHALTATNAEVTVDLPDGVTFGGSTSPLFINENNGAVTFRVPTLGVGADVNLDVQVTVDAVAPIDAPSLVATATVTHDDIEPTVGDNTDLDTDTLDAAPDYVVTVSDDNPGNVEPTDTLTYTVTVTNDGNQPGRDATTTLELPIDAVTFLNATGGGGFDPATGEVTWDVSTLAPNESYTYTVTVQVRTDLTATIEDFTTTASLTDDGGNGPDPTPGDASQSVTTTLEAVPDLEVSVTDNLGGASPGDPVTYTITVANLVPGQEATGVVVINTVPTDVLTAIIPGQGGSYDPATGEITWNVASIPVGSTMSFTYDAVVQDPPPNNVRDYVNAVTVTDDGSNGVERNLANNTAEDVNSLDVFVFDGLSDARGGDVFQAAGGQLGPSFFAAELSQRAFAPSLPIDPVYSGLASPGAAVSVEVYDATGQRLGTTTVTADAAGNWSAPMPSSTIQDWSGRKTPDAYRGTLNFDYNHRVFTDPTTLLGYATDIDGNRTGTVLPESAYSTVVTQSPSAIADELNPQNTSFAPAANAGVFVGSRLSVASVFMGQAEAAVVAAAHGSAAPLGLGWGEGGSSTGGAAPSGR